MNGILKFFSTHLGSELRIYGDRKLIRFFSACGKMGLIKRERIDGLFFQCSFLPDPYICGFFQHLLSFVFILMVCSWVWTILCNICTDHLCPDLCSILCTAL